MIWNNIRENILFFVCMLTWALASCDNDGRYQCHPGLIGDYVPYCHEGYNSVGCVVNHFGKAQEWESVCHARGLDHFRNIFKRDGSVEDTVIKVYGHVVWNRRDNTYSLYTTDTLYDWRTNGRGRPIQPAEADSLGCIYYKNSIVTISFDTTDHAIGDKLLACSPSDTAYLAGRLRRFFSDEIPTGCFDILPGIWVDSAEDITLSPKDPQP